MALTVKSGASVLALARAALFGSTSPEVWLVGLRWIAAVGMATTALVASALVPGLDRTRLLLAIAAVAVSNVGWRIVVSRGWPRGSTVQWQIAGDVVLLAVVLWHSGGVGNPFASFLTFQIVLAGILGSRRTTLLVTLLAVAAAGVLCFAPPLPVESAGPWRGNVEALARAVSVLALSGFTGLFVLVFADRLERLRELTSRSEKLAGLGRTIAAICHELNTPLGTILVAGKDLEHVGRELGSDDVQLLARTVADDARRAADIIGLMRGYVSPSERKEPVELVSFVQRYVAQELDRLGFAGERVIEAGPPAQLTVLRAGISQILTNVLKNAVEAMANTPDPRMEVRITSTDDAVEISLRDNGPGVSPDLIDRIGEPFQTTKARRGGSGLGLYVSSLLAERTDGSLHLDSAPGRGTCVTITLRRPAD